MTTSFALYIFTLCETNDAVNDYYAFQVNDTTNVPDELLILQFDDEHDGAIVSCGSGFEDLLAMRIESDLSASFEDNLYCSAGGGPDGDLDGAGAAVFTPTAGYVYEMSHPLNSGDSSDYALSPGDTVGLCLRYRDWISNFGIEWDFPVGCRDAGFAGNASGYGDVIKFAPPATTTTTGPPLRSPLAVGGESVATDRPLILLPWMALTIIFAVIAFQMALSKRRRPVPKSR